ncbi:hypothetical protein [Tichowtungia aerotolerans]|uniref:Glycoside hydrolase n=1 Tax=Tichowtungia aerotolerans TaxID=2697043 RepID=A0A6P1M7E9_9BACT|nr:hypothetical protein [Tichowtungia aerotolerans]QHI68484.1 hypothetical protein GT409_03115 [Tichowtungia aerotolerans]
MKQRNVIKHLGPAFSALSAVLLNSTLAAADVVTSEDFKNPPNEYRVTQYQLNNQTLKKYPQYGIGGCMAFFYNELYRQGPTGPAKIGPLVDAAHASGCPVWLADDWGYPSGMAGGKVVAENPEYEVKGLTMLELSGAGTARTEYTLPADLYDIAYACIVPVEDGQPVLTEARKITVEQRQFSFEGIAGDWQVRIFARYVRDKDVQAQSTMPQFGHTGRYPDLMNREAIARFIAHMHEPILAQITDPSQKVEGFYCNEPNLMQTHWTRAYDAPYACVPWTDKLPARFKEMHGYDLYSVLPHLFEGGDDNARRARIHFRQAVAALLTDSFSKQIRQWCNARGIKSSGHFLLNEYLSMHVQGYGDMMKFVSEFDVPALDIPIPNPDQFETFEYQQSRFFSSVAAWKERDMTLMLLDPIIGGYGLKRLSPDLPLLINSVNMAAFHGVNMFTSYLPLDPKKKKDAKGRDTSAKGYTKAEYRFLNEYTGRITQVLRGARREAGVGLYYPIAMFQADLLASDKFWPQIRDQYTVRQHAWDQTEKALLDGDMEYMIVHPEGVAAADIADGRIIIGSGSYHTLVMPQLEFLPLAVGEQLKRFELSGGKVIWVDQIPRGAEHAENDLALQATLKNKRVSPVGELASTITASYSSEFDLTFSPGTEQLTVGRFHKDGRLVYLLVNRKQEAISVNVNGGAESVQVLDPSTGEIRTETLPVALPIGGIRAMLLIAE